MNFYAWPGFGVNQFEMDVDQNERLFVGPYTPTLQVLDLLGERWRVQFTLAPISRDPIRAAAFEAYWSRLRGHSNGIAMGHQRLKAPQGTMRGGVTAQWQNSASANANWLTASSSAATWSTGEPTIRVAIGQLASIAVIGTLPGRTLLAGDPIKFGGQLVRVLVNAVADGSGNMPIEFTPRARQAMPAGTVVEYIAPTANFILKPGATGVPTSWTPGDVIDGATVELIETF